MRSILTIVVLAGFGSAQSIYLPSTSAATFTSTSTVQSFQLFGLLNTDSHILAMYATADIPVPVAFVSSFAMRRLTGNVAILAVAFTWTGTVQMSVAPASPGGIVATFAANHGPTVQTVHSGTISFPTVRAPAPLFEASVPLMTPFLYLAPLGQSLAVEMTGSRLGTGTAIQGLEAHDPRPGSVIASLVQPGCVHSGGVAATWLTSPPALGTDLSYVAAGYPNQQPSLAANALCFGVSGPGGSWLGQPLPFLLSTLGIPAPAGCQWGIDVLATVPMTYRTSLATQPNQGSLALTTPVRIPAQLSLAGQKFFTQVAALDTNSVTLQPEVFPSHVLEWTIGDGRERFTMVWRGDLLGTAGTIATTAPPLKLN